MTSTASKVIRTDELPPELRQALQAYLKEVTTIKGVLEDLDSRHAEVKRQVAALLERLGPVGTVLEDSETGLAAQLTTRTTNTISRESLLGLGVSAAIIQQATTEKTSEPFLTIRPISKKK